MALVGILEGNDDAARRMEEILAEIPDFHCKRFADAHKFIEWIRQNAASVSALSITDDLGPSGESGDPGSGADVVEFLQDQEPSFPVILHSRNAFALPVMSKFLEGAGWTVRQAAPTSEDWAEFMLGLVDSHESEDYACLVQTGLAQAQLFRAMLEEAGIRTHIDSEEIHTMLPLDFQGVVSARLLVPSTHLEAAQIIIQKPPVKEPDPADANRELSSRAGWNSLLGFLIPPYALIALLESIHWLKQCDADAPLWERNAVRGSLLMSILALTMWLVILFLIPWLLAPFFPWGQVKHFWFWK